MCDVWEGFWTRYHPEDQQVYSEVSTHAALVLSLDSLLQFYIWYFAVPGNKVVE